ncbi:MAG: nucleotidyltransferase family protein [Gammaproteobacteria bacterium]|nr:nucleotidyltransferase family protein [Gammaproteobacteria bacterium]
MKTLAALCWIIGFLEQQNIPYVMCGGLAAKDYGAKRKLNDIDIYVPDENFQSVVDFGIAFITYSPSHHLGAQWDLTYVKFNYQSQDIEVGSDKACKIFNHHQSKWLTQIIDFQLSERYNIFGVEL